MATVKSLIETESVTVILFGPVARVDATPSSDVDLAVIAPPGWDERIELEDNVRTPLGNDPPVPVVHSKYRRRAAMSRTVRERVFLA